MRQPRYPNYCSGFTLLELLISITLVSVIVMILSLGLRSGLRAWTRGKETNRTLVATTAIERLLGNQLRALASNEAGNLVDMAEFEGDHRELVFITTYVPMGAEAGGIFKVVYRYYPRNKRFVYAQKVITSQDDLRENLPDDVDIEDRESLNAGWLISEMTDIPEAGFNYMEGAGEDGLKSWEKEWKTKGAAPARVALCWNEQEPGEDGDNCTIFPTTPLDF